MLSLSIMMPLNDTSLVTYNPFYKVSLNDSFYEWTLLG